MPKEGLVDIYTKLIRKSTQVVGRGKAQSIQSRIVEDLPPIVTERTKHGDIYFFCPGRLPYGRAKTLLTKEPETIKWLDTILPTHVLWDIGACVGVYSLYPATLGTKVFAFEPSASNYYTLNRNIEINHLNNYIQAFNIAFTDTTQLNQLFMPDTNIGGALNSFGSNLDYKGNPFVAKYRQSVIGYTIDAFIEQFQPPFPNFIKIDVDGIEDKIITGAPKTLSDTRLNSVLIELNTEREDFKQVIHKMKAAGLSNMETFPNGDTTYNHIFYR